MRSFVFAAVVLMAGFAQAASPATPAAPPDLPPPTCAAAAPVKLIAAYGDSTTQGIGADETHSMPVYLQSMLCNAKVVNEGVSGTRADQLLHGTDGKHKPWGEEMAQSKAHIILINFGINDSRQAGETTQSYSMNMDLLIRTAKKAGKIVVLATPNPIFPGKKADAPDPKLQAHAQSVRNLAKAEQVELVEVNSLMLTLLKQRRLNELYYDTLHPQALGYQYIAKAVAETIAPLH